jgi:hypothetical protein
MIYRVSLGGARDVSNVDSLAASNVEPVQKELLVDLAHCPSSGAKVAPGAARSTQPVLQRTRQQQDARAD